VEAKFESSSSYFSIKRLFLDAFKRGFRGFNLHRLALCFLPTFSQGLTLVHFSAQRKHLLMDIVGISRGSVTQNGSG
jgi:hypothetical protein